MGLFTPTVKPVLVRIDVELLKEIDRRAANANTSREGFIRAVIGERLGRASRICSRPVAYNRRQGRLVGPYPTRRVRSK